MELILFVTVAFCQLYYAVDSYAAGEAYLACLNAASNTSELRDCYYALLDAVGNATTDFFACVM